MPTCGRKCKLGSIFGVATALIILGAIIVIIWPTVFRAILQSQLTLGNDTKGFDIWKETPIPMYMKLHLFNWTNSEEVLRNFSVKPILQQCGPYTYKEKHIRVNLQWNDNATITYQQKRIWEFIPEKSNGSLSDKITHLNAVAVTVAYIVRNQNNFIKLLVNFLLNEKERELIVTKTADELLFGGYEDELLELVMKLNITGINLPFDKFGWFYARNGSATYDGNWTIYTGRDYLNNLGIMNLWNGVKQTRFYDSYCGYVNGTSGELWPPVKDYDSVSIFASDVCSDVLMNYTSDATVRGVVGKKYVGSEYAFDNGTKYPEQACFSTGEFSATGLRNVSKCKFGAPAFVSYPHFYLSDPSYLEAVEGLTPNKSLHEMYLVIEPTTGIPLDVSAQLQISLLLQPIERLAMFDKVKKKIYLPLLWFEQSVSLTDEYANLVKVLLLLPSLGLYTGYGMLGIGVLLCGIGAYVVIRLERDVERKKLLSASQESIQ